MPTLHIEHSIVDFDLWSAAFQRFADARHRAGVRSHHVRRPVDDAHYVVIDLDFDTTDQAQAFLNFLRDRVWASPKDAPALVGTPEVRILEDAYPNKVPNSPPRMPSHSAATVREARPSDAGGGATRTPV